MTTETKTEYCGVCRSEVPSDSVDYEGNCHERGPCVERAYDQSGGCEGFCERHRTWYHPCYESGCYKCPDRVEY
jgi:hypothetical protein